MNSVAGCMWLCVNSSTQSGATWFCTKQGVELFDNKVFEISNMEVGSSGVNGAFELRQQKQHESSMHP